MADIDINRIEKMISEFKDEIKVEFRHQLGIQSEHFQHKLDVVVEGHQMLAEKIDRVEERLDKHMDCLEHKLDAVAADLAAHRVDTEVHKKPYRIREE
ncbi:MAG: hypothetical protein PHN75_02905 [Syntrophales bacterium]|nr:hypothetical protein [Syntrophales bacterium]